MHRALDVRLRGAGRHAETPGSQRKDTAFRRLDLLAMSRRTTAQSTLRAAGKRRTPKLELGTGRAGRAPRMGTVRLSHRGTKPQPTPRPLRTPSLAAVPLPPPRAVSRPLAHRPAEATASNQPSAAPLCGRRHRPACCGRGRVTARPLSFPFPPTDTVRHCLPRAPGVTLIYGCRRGGTGQAVLQ